MLASRSLGIGLVPSQLLAAQLPFELCECLPGIPAEVDVGPPRGQKGRPHRAHHQQERGNAYLLGEKVFPGSPFGQLPIR